MVAPDSPHILIVDDNPQIHEDFRLLLAPPAGPLHAAELDELEAALFGTAAPQTPPPPRFVIECASQGQQAVALAAQACAAAAPYALAFVDVRMPPGWDGIETTARLWQIDPDIQVVLCTAFSDYSWDQTVERLGRDDRLLILKKPFEPIEVLQLAQALTAKWRLQRQTRALLHEATRKNQELLAALATRDAAQSACQDAIESSRLKSQFLANMSHEIRTPMNGVLGMISLALLTELTAEQKEYLRTAQSSAEALLVILNDILDLSKIEAGKLTLELLPLSLPALLDDCLRPLSVRAEQKGLRLWTRVGDDVAPWILGDPGRLRQILTNLVGNAIKFTATGEIGVELTRPAPGALRVRVVDSGLGIPAEQQAHIFEAFTQADGTTTRRFGGTGLGLTICRELVALMGGQIHVHSQPGAGSTFWFEIPVQAAPMPPAPSAPAPMPPPPAALRVLLVEDNPVNMRVGLAMLRKLGHQATQAEHGRRALELLEAERFDAVLMDLQMPEMDGLQATRELRRREEAQGRLPVPVIALTANAMKGDSQLCLDAGMDAYLSKPVQLPELAAILAQVCRERGAGAAPA